MKKEESGANLESMAWPHIQLYYISVYQLIQIQIKTQTSITITISQQNQKFFSQKQLITVPFINKNTIPGKIVSLFIHHTQKMDKKAQLQKIVKTYTTLKQQPQHQPLQDAVQLIKQVVGKSSQGVYVSFNGGKDATVVLFLTYLAFRGLESMPAIKCLYFEQSNPFEQMQQFIQTITKTLSLQVYRLSSKQYAQQLQKFSKDHPLEYVIMGSRKDDPGCAKLPRIADSDVHKGYPTFRRLNPIIQWECSYVWKVIRELGIPYCRLYEEGYTSIGDKNNTSKNEALYEPATKRYMPAYRAGDEHERKNREKL